MRYTIAAIISAAILAGCGGGDKAAKTDAAADKVMQQASKDALEQLYETPDGSPASVLPARTETLEPPADLSPITEASDILTFKTVFPAELNQVAPELGRSLVEDAGSELEQARAFAQEAKDEGSEYFRAHDYETIWSMQGGAEPLISLQSSAYTDTGGAHPNSFIQGLIYDTGAREQLAPMDIFASAEEAYAVLKPLLAETLTDEKLERYGEPMDDGGVIYAELMETLPPVEEGFTNAVLLPSTEDGKLGGMLFIFPPYAIGPYVEGGYEAVVAQADIHAALKPDYQPLFSGDPVYEPEEY